MTLRALEAAATMERRHFPRKQLRIGIEMEWGSAVLRGTVRDLSTGGLFVELVPPLWIGAAFQARLLLQPVVSLDCTVVRVEPGVGVGVTFDVRDAQGRTQIEKLLVSAPAT